jgi:alpha-amylase
LQIIAFGLVVPDYVSGFVRYGNARHHSGLACIISNSGAAKKRMFIGRRNTNQRWIDILRHRPGAVIIDKWGYGLFTVNAMSASVWVDSAAVSCGDIEEKLCVSPYLPLFHSLFCANQLNSLAT